MTAGRGGALASVVAAALLVAALGACGRKGPPVPPERRVPQQVTDLRGVVREGRIELEWSVPRRRLDGSRLVDPGQARVFRAEDAGTADPKPALLVKDRIAGYTEVASIRLADPPSPLVTGGRTRFPDQQGLTVGRRYTYVVATTDSQGRTSAPSPRLTLSFLATPEPPTGLRGEPGERQVRLAWNPPERLSDGSAVDAPLVYEILRSAAADAPLTAVSRTEPGATSTVDGGLENDRTYHYAVRAIRQEGETAAEGATSARIALTPIDVTPPAPASNLVAVPSQGTVRLSWTPSPDADVAGYVVYRSGGGEPMVRVGSVRAPGTTFTDRDVPAGAYRYTVTAQDTSASANESRPTDEAVVTVP
jgi:hypothetical protein